MTPARLNELNDLFQRVVDLRHAVRRAAGDMPPDFVTRHGVAPETAAEMLKLVRNDLVMQLAHAQQEFDAA